MARTLGLMIKKFISSLFVAALTGQAGAAPVLPSDNAAPAHRVAFAFHSAFLMNLHHFLYDMAVHKDKLATVAWEQAPTAQELRALHGAIDFYRRQYAALGIREAPLLVGIKIGLSAGGDDRRRAGGLNLPRELEAVLDAAAPAYARCLRPLHDRSNRAWIARAAALDTAYGAQVQGGIEHHMENVFTTEPIRTDVVFETGSRQGAYTDEQIVIPSGRRDYQDLASLEMLYHEASHTGVTVLMEEAIDLRLKASGRSQESDLWHVVQFYTVGEVTREVLARHGQPGYQPYADKRGLYAGYWAPYMKVIDTVWREHMAGKMDVEQAATAMVDRLPRQ
jgi:hypothetical protein